MARPFAVHRKSQKSRFFSAPIARTAENRLERIKKICVKKIKKIFVSKTSKACIVNQIKRGHTSTSDE